MKPSMFAPIFAVVISLTAGACSAPANVGTAQGELASTSATGTVQVIVEPSDDGSSLVNAMSAATRSVHMTMYELTASDVISALIARHRAGVDVRVVLNANFDPSTTNFNQPAFNKLSAAGVSVVWAPSTFTFTHEKCAVIDGTSAWIMTMNATKTAPTENREYLAVDTIAEDVAEAEAQFAADFAHQSYVPSGGLLVAPVNARSSLAALFASAQQSIDFEVEELSDPAVATELCAAAERHVKVRGALSTEAPSAAGQRARQQLASCGVSLVSFSALTLHAKAVVVDGARAFVGSENFSTTSLDQNRELGLVTDVASAVATVRSTIDADIATGTPL